MSFTETLRSELLSAMKAKDENKKDVLRVVLGEVETTESRSGVRLPEDKVQAILRKLIESNEETIRLSNPANASLASDETSLSLMIVNLREQNTYLSSLLPKRLTKEEILSKLNEPTASTVVVNTDILSAKSEGQAIGLAMKFFKTANLAVDGNLVKEVVIELRNQNG